MVLNLQRLLNNLSFLLKQIRARAFLKKLHKLDLNPLVGQLIDRYGWTSQQTRLAVFRYLMFLCLARLYPDRYLIPTQEIDLVWHCHILQTRKYRHDCQFLFGGYLDHEPSFVSARITYSASAESQAAFVQTKYLFEQHFGIQFCEEAPDPAIAPLDPIDRSDQSVEPPLKLQSAAACGRPIYRVAAATGGTERSVEES